MDLEKKFKINLTKKNLISNQGQFSTVFKVFDENGDVYCGKFPRMFVFEDPEYVKHLFPEKKLDSFAKCQEYSFNIAKDLYTRFNLALKPEGVYLVKIEGVQNFYLPALVNELAINMGIENLSNSEFQEFIKERRAALKKVIYDGYFMHHDVMSEGNIFYSTKRGIKFNDFDLWGKNGNFNKFIFENKNSQEFLCKTAIAFADVLKKDFQRSKPFF